MKRNFLIKFVYCSIFLLVSMFLIITMNMTDYPYTRGRLRAAYHFESDDELEFEDENQSIYERKTATSSQIELPIHDQEDARLVRYVSSKINPPSTEDVPYVFRLSDFETSQGQGVVVRRLTDYKEKGFFVECGAGDGEFFSNTLFLEKHLGWTGLLVEANPDSITRLREMHRRAYSVEACMSLNTSAYESFFERNSFFLGKVLETSERNAFKVNCYPFYTFLLALNVSKIDYFSLDVEGHEVEILETIPFDKVDITVLSVEFSKSRGGLLGVKGVMQRNGYRLVQEVSPDDLIFVKQNHPRY